MTNPKKNHVSRWGLIALAAGLVILLLGSAIYAQGFGRRAGGQGPGMGRGMGMGFGPAQGPGPGMGPGGPGRLGLGMLMADPDIRDLMAKIRIVGAINHLELTADQVESLRDLAVEAQEIVKGEFQPVRDQLVSALQDQLDDALAGGTPDPEIIRRLMEEARENHEPGEIRPQLEEILNRAIDVLTEEQRQRIIEECGPDPERIRERVEEWREGQGPGFFGGGQGPDGDHPGPGFFGRGMGPDGGPEGWGPGWGDLGREWFESLSDEEREQIRERFEDRIGNMREGAAKMKLMMFLLAPESIEAMDLWLEAH